jgi:hypothetical protein
LSSGVDSRRRDRRYTPVAGDGQTATLLASACFDALWPGLLGYAKEPAYRVSYP